jgi:hypothetical protein
MMENPYKFDHVARKITLHDLHCILDSLKFGNCVLIPPHSWVGDIYLSFMCHTMVKQDGFVFAKFTNDDRRKFIKIGRDGLKNYNINKDKIVICYNSIIM